MPNLKLTDLGLLNLKPSPSLQDYWDTTLPTFGVRLSPKGTKTFILKTHNARRKLGRYPIISLSEARTEAKRILAEYTLGKVRPQSITFSEAVKLFVEDKKKNRRTTTADQYKWFLDRLDFKGQLADITPQELERQLKKVKSPSTNDHVLIAARIFFNWAIKRRYVDRNPTLGLSPRGTKRRKRILSPDELKAIWAACENPECDVPKHYRDIVRLLLILGQRRGEIAALRTSFIEGNLVTLPETLTKNGREHAFPLPDMAAEILRKVDLDAKQNDALFFPARAKPDKPFNGWSKSKKELDRVSGVQGWVLHDLRRHFRTTLGRLGVMPHIAEMVVNHVSARSDMELVYDLWKYLPEMTDAMTRHEQHLKTVLGLEYA